MHRSRSRAGTILRVLVVVVRRTRVLPLTLTALALGAFALAAPLAPYDDDARSTAALSTTSPGEQGLVPATGDGWTQDGVPVIPPPSDVEEGPRSSSPASVATSAPPSSRSSTAARASAVETGAGSASASSTARTSSSSTSVAAPPPASAPGTSQSSSAPPSGTPEVATPAVDPVAEILGAVDTARAAAGCAPLAADEALAALAAEHSAAVRDGGSPPDLGNRTAVTVSGTDPAAIAAGWLQNGSLLDCALTTAGVGTADTVWTLVAA